MFVETKYGNLINTALIECVVVGYDEKDKSTETKKWKVMAQMISGKLHILDEFRTKEEALQNRGPALAMLIQGAMPSIVMPGQVSRTPH